MKKFLKAIGFIFAIFGAAFGALFAFDRYSNRNRIKGDYLECEVPEDEADIIEE